MTAWWVSCEYSWPKMGDLDEPSPKWNGRVWKGKNGLPADMEQKTRRVLVLTHSPWGDGEIYSAARQRVIGGISDAQAQKQYTFFITKISRLDDPLPPPPIAKNVNEGAS